MAGGEGGKSLEETPTWAVAVVFLVLVSVSIIIEYIIHLIGKWLMSKHKKALYDALEKIKSELMLLGFISLLLTVLEGPILDICIPASVGATWHPCSKKQEEKLLTDEHMEPEENGRRRLLIHHVGTRRVLAPAATDKCAPKGKVPLVSADGIHQLHILIFVLAVFHVLYSITTLALGKAKMRRWKAWEEETRTAEYQFNNDPERYRFARETTFGKRHLRFWTKTPILLWTVCFIRQFVRSVPKVDYVTLRHGFIMAHLAPQSETKYDFQKYIKRSLEKDFKVIVGISPPMWLFAGFFLLFNTHGWYSYLWLPFIPLMVILLVGTKLQVIITKMGLSIEKRNEVIQGSPVVEPRDDLFWFNSPRLILFLINFVLFQNAFQLAFFVWTWYEFGIRSCYHEHVEDIIIRISLGILIQILCSYVTLPLYALVTQMGSNMKPTIFNDKVAAALKNWHHTAKKNIKDQSKHSSAPTTPMSSRPGTPSHGTSPVHLLRGHYQSEMIHIPQSTHRKTYHYDFEHWGYGVDHRDDGSSPSPSPFFYDQGDGQHGQSSFSSYIVEKKVQEPMQHVPVPSQHEIHIEEQPDFSFVKRLE